VKWDRFASQSAPLRMLERVEHPHTAGSAGHQADGTTSAAFREASGRSQSEADVAPSL